MEAQCEEFELLIAVGEANRELLTAEYAEKLPQSSRRKSNRSYGEKGRSLAKQFISGYDIVV